MIKNQFRQNFYILFGIFIGFIFRTFSPFFDDTCISLDVSRSVSIVGSDTSDEYVPKMNILAKQLQDQQNTQKILRPRYFSTELGIKKKLFVAVLTTQQTINTHGVAVNKTASHIVDKLTFFIDAPGTQKLNVSYLKLPGIVGFIDTRVVLKPFHILKYIKDNFIENYDYFFIVNDNAYIKARKLNELVQKISVSQDVYAGTTVGNSKFCSFSAGILLSNSVMQKIAENIDWCVKNVYSSSDDENFGKCVLHSSDIVCQKVFQNKPFTSYRLKKDDDLSVNILKSADMNNAISVYPMKNERTFYMLHAYFSMLELTVTNERISELRHSIIEMAQYTPFGNASVTWPVGNQPGNEAPTRFDLLRWDYFTETHIYLTNEFNTIRPLNEAEKLDIEIIVNASVEMINSTYNNVYKFHSLMNGYRRFDPSRGMDYKLDIIFQRLDNLMKNHKRIEICKPLGKVELLSVPYVTENRRVNIILPIRVNDRDYAKTFLKQYKTVCLDKKEKIFLVLVFIYDFNVPGKGTKDDVFLSLKSYAQTLSQIYKRDENRVIWLSIKIPFMDNLAIREALFKFAVLDLSLKKFPQDSLILLGTPYMEIKVEYLNRVRMNTILGWQVFSPIPFSEYNPLIHGMKKNFIDLNKKNGHFDSYNTDHISFYVKDYFATRKKIEEFIPIVKSDSDIKLFHSFSSDSENLTSLALNTIYSMFVQFGDVHVIRAVESALRLQYQEKDCSPFLSIIDSTVAALRRQCLNIRNANLGSRGLLSKLLLDYQETNNINDIL